MGPWTDLGDGILVRQSAVYGMNSPVLLDREHAVLVDPGVLPSELDDTVRAVREVGPRAVTLAFTHAHWDHVLGLPWWPGAATLGHARLAGELERDRDQILAEATSHAVRSGESWSRGFRPFAPDLVAGDERPVALGPWKLVPREAPGHCDSQVTLHLPERRLLIAGDMLSDIEIPWLDREPAVYRRALERLEGLATVGEIGTLVPGHGSIARGEAAVLGRVRRDLAYLDALESGARAARAAGIPWEEAWTRMAAMDYPGKGAAYPMDHVHSENARLAWEAAARG